MNKANNLKLGMSANKGITLIALIITIIVLFILAEIAMITLTGENGILNRTNEAKVKNEKEQAREKLQLILNDLIIEKKTNNNYDDEVYTEKLKREGIEIIETNIEAEKTIDTVKVDGWKFQIDRDNLKIIKDLNEKEPEQSEEAEDAIPSYVSDGLIVLYDGINNTGEGHSDTATTWKNLAPISEQNVEGANNGWLMNIQQGQTSGWKNNCLTLDGIDDWVKMSPLSYQNMTIEIVAKSLSYKEGNQNLYIANLQRGGMMIGVAPNAYLVGEVNVSGTYYDVFSEKEVINNKIYSLSTGYNGENIYFSVDGDIKKNNVTGVVKEPDNNTVFALGVNPDSNGYEGITSNIEIYSVRIYNRCLTEEEIQKNCEIDKKRYHIKQPEELPPLGYVTNGLQVLYDGKRNTPYGYNKGATRWRDLSGNQRDTSVINTAGWDNHALVFKGGQFAQIANMNYSNITMEAVVESNQPQGTTGYIISNIESGGYGMFSWGPFVNGGIIHVNGGYQNCVEGVTNQSGTKCAVSVSYDGNKFVSIQNGSKFEKNLPGTMKMSSVPLSLGYNPEKYGGGLEYFYGKIYAIRVYNRALTQEEKNTNYEIDRQRFEI